MVTAGEPKTRKGGARRNARDSAGELIEDLIVASVPPELVGRVANMLVARAARHVAAGVDDEGVSGRSPGAVRTARYRARLKLREASKRDADVTGVTSRAASSSRLRVVDESTEIKGFAGSEGPPQRVLPLMSAVTGVTNVTQRDSERQKEIPPHPPKKKHNLPQEGVSASQPSHPTRLYRPNWRHADDPVFQEAERIRGHSLPRDKRGGWEIGADLIAQAEAQLHERGPPRHRVTG